MPKLIEEIPLVTFNKLNHNSDVPLNKQLYNLLQEFILSGKLKPGQKLPGTRSLAADLNVSRNTVSIAFNQLLIEGYIKGKIGSGTFVNEIPDNLLQVKIKDDNKNYKYENSSIKKNHFPQKIIGKSSTQFHKKKISNYAANLIAGNSCGDKFIPFQMGIPSLNDFPIKTWLRITNQVYQTFSSFQLGYGDSAGYLPLREAIASYLKTYRAVNCNADQIIIVSGSQQGLDLIGRVLLKTGDVVWLEDPGYLGARTSMIFSGAEIYPSPLDKEGLDIEDASNINPKPNLIYTTPSHQFPLGVTMSISRRLQLLQYAKKNKCWVIEDDYDSEFRYSGNPLPSLQGMDKNEKVIYLGTFSKVLFPALRLGYLVLPNSSMTNAFASAKYLIDRQCPIFEQIILTKFIEDGHFTRHIRKMRMLYKIHQEFLIAEINKELKGIVTADSSPAGMHLIIWLSKNLDDKKIAKEAEKNNLIVKALSEYSIKYFKTPGLILGYTAFNKKEIIKGIHELKNILKKYT